MLIDDIFKSHSPHAVTTNGKNLKFRLYIWWALFFFCFVFN